MSDEEHPRDPNDRRVPPVRRQPSLFTRIRLPLWLVLGLMVGLSVFFLFLLAGRSKIELGPSVKGADIQACVLLPDPRPAFDVSQSERAFEDALKEIGATNASVRVQRPPDVCPPNPPATAPSTTAPPPSPSPSPPRS